MLNKIKAINNYGIEVKDIEKIENNIFTINNGEEYYVLTDEEAQEIYVDLRTKLINELKLEGYNLLDIDKVIEFCQEVSGRGHIMASYDGLENEIEIDNTTYYIYRLN